MDKDEKNKLKKEIENFLEKSKKEFKEIDLRKVATNTFDCTRAIIQKDKEHNKIHVYVSSVWMDNAMIHVMTLNVNNFNAEYMTEIIMAAF